MLESVITLNTTQPELGTTIENKVVQDLPVELDEGDGRGRQIDAFIFLAPGVTGGTFSKRINGGVDFESEVVFNGIPMAQSETQGFQTIWNPPFEQVNEFNVLRSSFSAQYGLAQGVVTYQTASGTNDFHGDVFEILRNNYFDARGAYNSTVPVDNENNYGFTIGGPVLIPKLYNGKNRTFFHFNMEWYRRNTPDLTFMSLPTAAEKQGNFAATGQIDLRSDDRKAVSQRHDSDEPVQPAVRQPDPSDAGSHIFRIREQLPVQRGRAADAANSVGLQYRPHDQ